MAEIKKTGTIPVATVGTYKDNYRIDDNIVGKYISLSNSKKFYSSGIGLDLSTPLTDTTTINKNFLVSGDKTLSNYHTGYGGADQHVGGYITYSLLSPTVNTINGIVNSNINIVRNFGISVSNPFNFNQIPISNNEGRILTVNESGTYTINFRVNGSVAAWRDSSVNNNIYGMSLLTQIKVNSNVEDISSAQLATQAGITYADMRLSGALNYSCTYSKTLTLNQGDYVQLYTKYVVFNPGGKTYGKNRDLDLWFNINHTNYSLSIDQVSTTGPANSFYTNPQNISDLKVKEINYYGNGKDTLKLIGNVLTS